MSGGGARTVRNVSVGVVVSLAALIFAIGIFSIGSEQRLWTRKVEYRIRLLDTNGLQVGAPVRLVGVQVGTVTDILFPDDPARKDIDVVFNVDKAVASRIRGDTEASLKVLSLLGGEKFLQLTPGSPSEPQLEAGAYIRVPEEMGFEELQAIGASIADDLQTVVGSLKVILEQLQNRETLLGQAIFDPNFGKETLGNIKASVASTREILQDAESGRGLAGRLLTDEEFAEATLGSIEGSLARIETLLARLADENGVAMRALAPEGPVAKTLENVRAGSETLLKAAEGLKEGKGTAGRLLTDDAYAEEVLGDLRDVARGLREITDKINRGDGTAGAFINDSSLYQDLRDVLRGVKKSKLMSWLIRHYREKGEKDRLEEAEEEKADEGPDEEGM